MTQTRFVGRKAEIAIGGSDPAAAYTRIPQAKDLKPASPSANTTDADDNDLVGPIKLPAGVVYGVYSATVNYNPADVTHQKLYSMVGDQAQASWFRHTHPDTAATKEWLFGWVSKFERNEPTKDPITGNLEIELLLPVQFTDPNV